MWSKNTQYSFCILYRYLACIPISRFSLWCQVTSPCQLHHRLQITCDICDFVCHREKYAINTVNCFVVKVLNNKTICTEYPQILANSAYMATCQSMFCVILQVMSFRVCFLYQPFSTGPLVKSTCT